jgi:hypothetical protein
MATKNDELILKLKADIESQKISLGSLKRFSPITNCVFEQEGKKTNLHILKKDELIAFLIYLNSLRLSANDLGYQDYKVSGFQLSEWIADLKQKLEDIKFKEEETKLKTLEAQLHNLLSQDKKVELEIEDIMKQLNKDK